MATVILTAAGNYLGGPIGGSIGAMIGQRIDQKIFAGKAREGARLGALAVQTSTYGSPIPRLFGRARVAGSVIWATDLIETRSRQSNGKGQPKTNVYNYAANFAVALSARPISRVGRIWADGKLLRGAAGDFKVQTGFRLHLGKEDQMVDPLIASVEGAANAPAYRGLAYAVFEDLQLADYGNRIPSLSFEVFADEGAVALDTVFGNILDQSIASACPTQVEGFVVDEPRARASVETLGTLAPLFAEDDGETLILREAPASIIVLGDGDLGATGEGEQKPRIAKSRKPASSLPVAVALRYYDGERDFQPGLQRAWRNGPASNQISIDAPATLNPDRAAMLAERKLTQYWHQRERFSITLPWAFLGLAPGQAVALPGHGAPLLVESILAEGMVVKADLVAIPHNALLARPADPGRQLAERDALHGPTTLRLVDLPLLEAGLAQAPMVYALAAGASPSWRKAVLLLSLDEGNSWQEAGNTAAPAIVGTSLTVLPAGPVGHIDRINSVDIALLNGDMTLSDCDFDGLVAGRNLALLGGELFQFGSAQPLGGGRYRLQELVRGRRGTEHRVAVHSIGEPFALIERETLLPLPVPRGAASVRVIAAGIGDAAGVEQALANPGQAMRPLSPVLLRAAPAGADATRFSWTRRSRDGWSWLDGVDAPLAEEAEAYLITLQPNVGPARSSETNDPTFLYAAADRAADLAAGATTLTVSVQQIGTFASSLPALLIHAL